MPPAPKPRALRQRRNRATTRATLPTEIEAGKAKIPPLPKRKKGTGGWHPRVLAWWRATWTSPMASEYLEADYHGLAELADLKQQYHIRAENNESIAGLAAEIRQKQAAYGLSPLDRRRLEWEVDRGEEAAERRAKRQKPKHPETPVADPRDVIQVVA